MKSRAVRTDGLLQGDGTVSLSRSGCSPTIVIDDGGAVTFNVLLFGV